MEVDTHKRKGKEQREGQEGGRKEGIKKKSSTLQIRFFSMVLRSLIASRGGKQN